MQDPIQHLKIITDTLLDADTNYGSIRQAVHDLKDLFCKAAGFDETAAALEPSIKTSGGQAIGPYSAALCITDMMRTRKFLLGLKEAIDTRLKQQDKPILVFYAGAGPFATLLTPLTTCFTPEQLQMVLLEINHSSVEYLHKTIDSFNMHEYIKGIEEADAVHYTIPSIYQPDILLSETMKPGLQKEPQVSIVGNLLHQCTRDPILVPETIKIEACLLGNLAGDPIAIHPLKTIMQLDSSSAMQIDSIPAISTGVNVELDQNPGPIYSRIGLTTTVTVFGEHTLGLQESGITLLELMMDVSSIRKYPATLLFQYLLNESPVFQLTCK